MSEQDRNLFITGRPGVGKTTAIMRTVDEIQFEASGFYTEELREGRKRVGFRIADLAGNSAVMAHVDFSQDFSVGKYGVDVEAVNRVGVAALERAISQGVLAVIDEVGKMELASEDFVEILERLLDADIPVIGTVHQKQEKHARRLKDRPDTEVWNITKQNRDEIPGRLAEAVSRLK